MKKDNLYFLTFISITVIFLIITSFGVRYFINTSANQLIEVQLESSKREANEISQLIYYQLQGAIEKKTVIENIQNTIKETHDGTSFISVFDWSGKEVCHPNITKVGQAVNSNQSLMNSLNEKGSSNKLYTLLLGRKAEKEIATKQLAIEAEIVFMAPVKDSDLIVAAHANLDDIAAQTENLKASFYTIFMVMGVFIILLSFFAVRIIGSSYEKQLEVKNTTLESELVNLSKLNTDLVAYQQKIVHSQQEASEARREKLEERLLEPSMTTIAVDPGKKRILTHIRNELVPVTINAIAFIYTENTITYIQCMDGKKSTSNMSLDDMFLDLDASLFFRANRQFIISISAIEKIIKYGNSQLKIVIRSHEAVEIIISKNRAAEFRQWLNI